MKLSSTMNLVQVDKGYVFKEHPIEDSSEYLFWVDDKYYVLLSISYTVVGETARWHIPVLNFGYQVEIKMHNKKKGRFSELSDVDAQSGLSTKKYFPDANNRMILRKIIGKNLIHFIRKNNPPIIIRGPITPSKKNLPRYYEITELISGLGFQEQKFRVDQMPKKLRTVKNNECQADDEMWIYIKDDVLWRELEGWNAL